MLVNNMKEIILISLSLLLSLSVSAELKNDTIFFVTEAWEEATNSDGTGIYWEMLRKIYNPKGIKIAFTIVPYERSIKMVQNKKADVAIGSYENEVENVIYPKWHFDADIVTAFFKSKNIPVWNGEKSMSGKKVVWVRGYAYDEYLKIPVKKI